jgi:predicted TIM-barrel fold metal-dependent hydrolase
MHALPFVDAHMHLWDLQRIRYPWLTPPFDANGPNGNVERIATPYGLTEYAHESRNWNVQGVVHVEAGAEPSLAVEETRWLQGQAARTGRPNAIIAHAALNDPLLDQKLAAHAVCNRVRGIRHIVNWHPNPARSYTPRDLTQSEDWRRGYALLRKYQLSFDLQAYPVQFPALAQFIAHHDQTPVIVNHAGMGVDLDADGIEQWRHGMRLLAALPWVSVKLSGFGFVWRPLDPAHVAVRVRELLDLFGPQRLLLASDFPTDRLFADFDTTLSMLRAAIADLSHAEQLAISAGNANRIYRLNLSLPTA